MLSGGRLSWTELHLQSLGPEARGPAIPGCVGQADEQQGWDAGIELQFPESGQVHMQGAGPELLLQVSGQSADRVPVNGRKHQRGGGQVQGILGTGEKWADELARGHGTRASHPDLGGKPNLCRVLLQVRNKTRHTPGPDIQPFPVEPTSLVTEGTVPIMLVEGGTEWPPGSPAECGLLPPG